MSFGTEREREAARRELAKMPPDLLRRVHEIAADGGVDTLDVMAFLIHEMNSGRSLEG